MRVGFFTAQMFVKLNVTSASLTLTAPGRSFQIDRENFLRLEETSILGIFKRGVRFQRRQPNLPATVIFYPSIHRAVFLQNLNMLGWS